MAKYCKWYAVRWEENNKMLFESQCGEQRVVSRYSKFHNKLRDESDNHKCPKCGKPTTIGQLMD